MKTQPLTKSEIEEHGESAVPETEEVVEMANNLTAE
jgi:hypothetical protein